jgi:predicted NUDIX family NTP pyrophosphohydrolase
VLKREKVMIRQSAGILVYRISADGALEVFLAHPGGPYWFRKDEGAWTIPKGEFEADEEPLSAATREFEEETGFEAVGPFIELGTITQRGGKIVYAWAVEGDFDPSRIKSNTFSIEWPSGSGRQKDFPEIDKAGWFSIDEARIKMKPEQFELVERLHRRIEETRKRP